MKRRSNRDYFGPMTGFKGILHRTAMFLLYPLRKPLIFFPLLILLYLIPTFIGELLAEGKMDVKVLRTNDTWYGMTYKEDVMAVRDSFKEMFEKRIYKADLFSDL